MFQRREKSLTRGRIWTLYHPACSLIAILTMLSQITNNICKLCKSCHASFLIYNC
jgi:hypothetical protein